MNLRNVQQWQSIFQEARTNIPDNELEGQPNTMLDETVQRICALLEDNCHLTVTNMQQEMAAHLSHKAGKAVIVHALQQLEM